MNTTSYAIKYQRKCLSHYQTTCDSYSFFNLLTSEDLLDKVEELLPEHRERLFPPTETLSMFLAQVMSSDSSCQNIVNKSAVQRLTDGLPMNSTHTGGFCRARKRLPLELIKGLAQHLGNELDQKAPKQWLWKKRKVRIVDGTTVTMPDTEANKQAFPQHQVQSPGIGFPICRIVGITSLESGMLLNAAIGPLKGKGGSEQRLLRDIQDTLHKGDILLGDALFATYFFMANMIDKGVDILMEQHGSRQRLVDFRTGKSLGQRDHLIHFEKPKIRPDWLSESAYESAPDTLQIREFKSKGKTIVTTMICPKRYKKADLSTLYTSRWHVELDLRNIKTTLGMSVVSCKTPEMILKEIWVYLLAYNLLRLLMSQSALLTRKLPRQLSFKHCLQLWLWALPMLSYMEEEMIVKLHLLMGEQQVGNRPGRIEPRSVKRRRKSYALLTVPRHVARTTIIKSGHTKKLK